MTHKKFRLKGRWTPALKALCLLALMSTINLTSFAQAKERSSKALYGPEAAKEIPNATYVKQSPNTRFPSFVRLSPSATIRPTEFFSWLKGTVKASEHTQFTFLTQTTDKFGINHNKYQQTFKGIPVDQSTYIVHVKDGKVSYFNGQAYALPEALDPKPALMGAEALEAAKKHIGADTYMWEDPYWEKNIKERKKDQKATYFPDAVLCWYAPELTKNKEMPTFYLAYRLDINAASPTTAKRVYVDAKSGKILNTVALESNCSGATVNTIFNGSQSISTDKFTANDWRLRDDCQAAEIRIRDWNSVNCTNSAVEIQNTTNNWTTNNERFGASVLWATKEAYAYWLNVQNRSGYNGSNGDVEGYINAVFSTCGGCCNAYTDNASMSFSGGTMKVGLGSSGTLANSWSSVDIIGHEFAHAVTGSSSMLVYQDESGALNESFSDIFGEATENYSTGSNDWLMGDDRTDGAIRDMSDPKNEGDPDTYGGANWCDYTDGSLGCTTGDAGGVHRNSGVQNYWFYLLSEGGTGTNDNNDDYSVTGVGLATASDVASGNLINELGTGSDYFDARDGAIQTAINMSGGNECANLVKQTTNAWYAVGVGDPFFDATASVTSDYNGRDVSCFNACDGAATVTVVSGDSPTYSWSNSATTQSISNLCPGVYTVTVTNESGTGCAVSTSVTIANTPDLTAVATATSNYNGYNVSCNGGDDGTATATPGGGTAPYTYSWSNGQTAANATGLSATTYTVTVTDANGCTESATVTLVEPDPLTIDAGINYTVYYGYPDSACATLNSSGAAGGVPPYTLTWNTGSNDASISVCPISSTVYYLTITDLNGCTAVDSTKVCVIDVRCGNKLDKVRICHLNSGSSNPLTLCVSLNDATNHLLTHGDQLAECGIDKTCVYPAAPKNYSPSASYINEADGYLTAFPNPFSDVTTVRFSLPENTIASVKVMDISGRIVAVLFDDATVANNVYDLNFRGDQYPAAMYFLVLRTEAGKTYMNKLFLTK